MLTQAKLKEMVHYCPITGIFTYLKTVNPRAVKGQVVGTSQNAGHLYMQYKRKRYQLHQLAFLYRTGVLPKEVDHKNNIPTDNSWRNLRIATHQQNCFNSSIRSDNTSGHKGIIIKRYGDREVYKARIVLDNKEYSKTFSTIEEAIEWRGVKALELHGDFAFNGINK